MNLSYKEICASGTLFDVKINHMNDFIEIWYDDAYMYSCVWLNHAQSLIPSTIFKTEIE